jgi:hypothetical protein
MDAVLTHDHSLGSLRAFGAIAAETEFSPSSVAENFS